MFTIKCQNCGNEVDITSDNVRKFVQQYDWTWNANDFSISEDTTEIAAFCTSDTRDETIKCKCGNTVTGE